MTMFIIVIFFLKDNLNCCCVCEASERLLLLPYRREVTGEQVQSIMSLCTNYMSKNIKDWVV